MNAGQRLLAWLRLALMALSVLLSCNAAWALLPQVAQFTLSAGDWGSSQIYGPSDGVSVCTAFAAGGTAYLHANGSPDLSYAFDHVDLPNAGCFIKRSDGPILPKTMTPAGVACPANSTAVTGGCQCNTGFDESGGQCVPHTNACTAAKGTVRVVNWTVGFTRSGDASDLDTIGPPMPFPATNEVCSAGCIVVGDPYAPGSQAWKSQSPTNQGLYRLSMDVPMTNSGDECTASAADAPSIPTTPEPPCPGYVGEVNGKLGCYGTAEKPVTTQPAPSPPSPPAAGNPAAGPKPATGEGSGTGSAGRTPTTGGGGNAGGPAGAAVGGTGTRGGGASSIGGAGTVTTPEPGEEQAACGAPGQPVCAVKVDESGMPSTGGDGMGVSGLNEAMDNAADALGTVTDSSGMDTSWGVIPSWFSSSACTPWTLGTFPIINRAITINICAVQDYAVAVMTFLWCVGTFFAILGMVGRTVGSGAH